MLFHRAVNGVIAIVTQPSEPAITTEDQAVIRAFWFVIPVGQRLTAGQFAQAIVETYGEFDPRTSHYITYLRQQQKASGGCEPEASCSNPSKHERSS